MPGTYHLRRFRGDDFEAVAALAVQASRSPETACGQPDVASVDEFKADYSHRHLEDEAWVAAAEGGRVLGFAAGAARNQGLVIDGPIVVPDMRNLGIGSALFKALEQDAFIQNARYIECGVRASNTRGLRFLERRGYMPSRQIFCYEAHQPPRGDFRPPTAFTLGELKPRYLLPYLMVMHECFPDYRLPSSPQRLFEPDKMKIFLALDEDDRPVGGVTAFYYPEDRIGYIYHLGVSEPARRQGLARALLLSACQWLWEAHGPTFVGLSTKEDEACRASLFERVGFDLQYALLYLRKPVEQPAETFS